MNINFELYKIFYVVANNKSISKGAEQLLISQPAVTQAIKNLEGQLGTTLFIRAKKGIILTNEGEELYVYIKEGMNYFVNGTNKIFNLKNLESGSLKIGASTSITENFLMPYINKFHKLYPNIEIKIINNLTSSLLKDLRNGNLDIVIGGEEYKENKDLLFKPIKEIEYIFISNVEKKLNVVNLKNEKIIVQANPSIARVTFDTFIKNNNLSCNIFMEVVSHRLVTEFVKSGLGIGMATKEYILKELNNKELFEIKTDISLPKRNIGYTIRNNFTPTYAVKTLIEIMK